MKLGSEKKGEVIALAVLLLVAAVLLWRALAPASGSSAGIAPVVSFFHRSTARPAVLDPTLNLQKLDQLRDIVYTGSGRDLFHFGAAADPDPAPAAPTTRQAAIAAAQARERALTPAGPPPPPLIPLRFYGFAQASGMPEKIFLDNGTDNTDDNYVVAQGDTINHRYLIENIGKASVRVKDLQTQSEQDLPLQQPPAGSQ